MEELINQMRSKFSGGGQGQVSWSNSSFPRERRIPPQKSLSFKGEKKSSNWFQRQLSRQMSGSGSGAEDEVVAVAVAAAAFAVRNTLRESTSTTTAAMVERAKSRKDREPQSPTSLEPIRSSLRFSGEVRGSPKNRAATSPTTPSRDLTLQKRTSFADQLEETEPPRPETPSPPKPLKPETPVPPKPLKPFPSMKEPPSLADKKTQVEPNTMRKPDTPSPEPVWLPPIHKQVTPTSAAPPKPRASRGDSAADAWEKAEMERIKERYDKLSSTILSWEQDKKKKARAKLDRAEQSELSRKRAKALQKFKEEMEQIKEITEGARAQAEERRRNEELKTREKAHKYRATGKLPRTCFCF